MNRGFTIVEVLIVLIVISILSSIGIAAYGEQQKSAASSEAEAMAAVVMAGAEKYYAANNEYPNVNDLRGSSTTGTTMSDADYANAAAILGVSVNSLKATRIKFTPAPCQPASYICTGISFAPNRLYYTTRDINTPNANNHYNGQDNNQCFPSVSDTGGSAGDASSGATAYIIAYQNPSDPTKWVMKKSARGTAQSLDAGNSNNPSARCPISS